jgi:hypothetical protein
MNNLAMLQALAFEPRKAFTELDARPRFWWPLLVLVIANVVMTTWSASIVDLEWLTHEQMSNSSFGANLTEEEIGRMAKQAADQQGFRAVIGACGTAIVMAIIMLLGALYYLLAGKITGVDRSYRHWFSLASWSSMPTVLNVIPTAFALFTATSSQIPQEALQPLSLNELFFKREQGQTGYYLLSNISILQLVSLYLGTVAVKLWSGRTWLFSFLFNALPLILIVGIWAIFALR